MTQEEQNLLIIDLSARLPYKVKCELSGDEAKLVDVLQLGGLGQLMFGRIEVKPYLRPMASMTNVEKHIYEILLKGFATKHTAQLIDWLNRKMFDYRGLISMGLALEATKICINKNRYEKSFN